MAAGRRRAVEPICFGGLSGALLDCIPYGLPTVPIWISSRPWEAPSYVFPVAGPAKSGD